MISVIIPVRNGALYLEEAIESILAQIYHQWELVLIDDASTDETRQIIEKYKKTYSKGIKTIQLKNNRGAYGAANLAMKIAEGEFIAIMDGDDRSHPDRFEKQVRFLLAHPHIIVVGAQAKIVDSEGTVIGEKVFPLSHDKIYAKYMEVHPMVHPTCMIRRSLLPDWNRLYEDKHGVNDDYYTFFTLFRYGKFANLPDFLLDYRIHLKNSSLINMKLKFWNTVLIRLKAVVLHGYRPSIIPTVKFLFQILILSLMTEKMVFYSYLVTKKLYAPSDLFNEVKREITQVIISAVDGFRRYSTQFASLFL